jgi:hypothetical protein
MMATAKYKVARSSHVRTFELYNAGRPWRQPRGSIIMPLLRLALATCASAALIATLIAAEARATGAVCRRMGFWRPREHRRPAALP